MKGFELWRFVWKLYYVHYMKKTFTDEVKTANVFKN